MSTVLMVEIHCDWEDGESACREDIWCDFAPLGVADARRRAKIAGWKIGRGGDLCPKHNNAESLALWRKAEKERLRPMSESC